MKPALTISPQDWMTASATRTVMRALGGFEEMPKTLFVGGCVRNALMGKPITDIDIATTHRPDKVMTILLEAGIRAIPTGLEHGTVTALIENHKFEITTLRRDVETDGRHAVIAFTDDWHQDAERRDFTINTLLASPEGKIFDPTGRGLDDIKSKTVLFVGEPVQRIAEDYLRILRFFRFYGQYGGGAADLASLEACRIHADKLQKLSKERITQEFLKILALPHAPAILSLMFANDVMTKPDIRGGKYKPDAMQRYCDMQNRFEVADVLGRLALLCGFDEKHWQSWLVLSNAQSKEFEDVAKAFIELKRVHLKKIRSAVYAFGNHAVTQAYLMRVAMEGLNPSLEYLDIARYWQAPVFPISGDDLIAKGTPPGKNLGKKLKALEEKWIKSDFKVLPKY